MQALVFGTGGAVVRDRPLPRPARGFAPVRVILSGICNTDLELARGYHGFSGVPGTSSWVRSCGGLRPGEASASSAISLACGRCSWCARGLARHAQRTVLGILRHPGAHAGYLTLPEANLREVPDSVTNVEAVFVEPLAAACEILDQLKVGADTRTAVLGAGKLGTLCAAVLREAGAPVALLGRNTRARAGSFDLVVEATGSPAWMPRAFQLVRTRGTIVWKTTHHGPAR